MVPLSFSESCHYIIFLRPVRLSDKLVELYPGVIIPPLPEKQVIGRFDDDFIEYRKRALEKFLNRVSKHEKLSVSPFFETFLMASHESFQRARMNHQSVYMTTAISAASWLGNTFSSIATKKGVEFEKSAVDIQMDDITEKVDKLTELMSNVRDQAYEFIKASCESSLSLTELSDCFQLLGEAEHPYDPIVASLYSNTGVFINAVGTEVGKQAHASIVSFEEAILEQLNLLRSVKRALSLREAARGHHIQCKNETLNCEAAHARVLGVEGKRDQVIPCKAAFENAQRAERDAKNRLEIITEDFLADYVRFKAEKAVDLRSILVKFAHLQVL